jgi:hypothetical protein
MAHYSSKDAVLVAVAALLQVALWQCLRWLGLQVHGEVPGASIPEWYALLSLPLSRLISIAPCFLVGFWAIRHGVALGALAGVLASVASWGFPSLPGVLSGWSLSTLLMWPVSHVFSSALAAAILGGVAGAAGAFFRQRVRPNTALNPDAPSARRLA